MNKMNFMLQEIPEKFSAKGGYNGHFVNQKGLDGKAVIEEAIMTDYCPAYSSSQVKACAVGLLESMIAGVARDGNPRSVDGFIKVQPILKGRFPKVDSSYDPKVNSVVVNVQLLKELKPLDTSNWSFNNVTETDPEPTPPGPVVPAPTLTAGYTEGHENNPGVIFTDGGFIMAGTNLTDAAWAVEWDGTGGAHTETIDPEAVEVTGGTSAIIAPAALAPAVGDTEAGMPIFITATTAGGTARFMGESSGE